MKYRILISVLLIALILAAGCSDEAGPDDLTPIPGTPSGSPQFSEGDIVAKMASQPEPSWLILGYDQKNDKYERTIILKNSDGSWGYRPESRSDMFPREDMEKLYPVKITHVAVSTIPVISQTVSVTATTTTLLPGPYPKISGITPNSGAVGAAVSITALTGENFLSGATVKLVGAGVPPINAMLVQAIDTKITCLFNLNSATAGKYDVVVTNPDGKSVTLNNGFTVTPSGPGITDIEPSSGVTGQTVQLTVKGSNFKNPAMVFFVKGNGPELQGGNVEVKSASEIVCALYIPEGTLLGEWNVVVRNVADRQNSSTIRKFAISNAT